jgi:hypothetical protein
MTTATAPNPPNTNKPADKPIPQDGYSRIECCNLHIALAEAGRVGKSTTIKHLAEYLSSKGEKYQIVDTDRTTPDVAAGYTPELLVRWRNQTTDDNGDSFAPLPEISESSGDPINDLLKEQIHFSEDPNLEHLARNLMKLTRLTPNLLVNIPANSYELVVKFLESNSIGTKPNSKIKLFNWWVSDGSHSSLDLFLETKLAFPAAHHIIVLNQGRSELIKDFSKYRWPSSLLAKYQDPKYKTSEIKYIPMPKLSVAAGVWYAKDGMSHSEIITDPDTDEFDLEPIRSWQAKVFEAIKKTGLI